MAWRESRNADWKYQAGEACPKFATSTDVRRDIVPHFKSGLTTSQQIVIPKSLVSTEPKYLEMSFDGHFVTPLLMVYHPGAQRMVDRIELSFEYAGTSITRMTHSISYISSPITSADRVMIKLVCHWKEHSSRDVSTG
jgi:hypothetical protein